MWIRWWCWRGGGSRPYCYRKIGNINHELFWCFGLFSVVIWLFGLLFATVVMVAIGDRVGLPWPVLLTIVTAGVIFIPGVPSAGSLSQFSHLMLPIFIPPLLWALARRASWAQVRRQWRSIIMLSVLLVIATAVAVGLTVSWLVPTLSVAGAMMIGAAISPPDPVAVDAVAEPAGVPRRLMNTLQTEGMFNDAASILVFNLALGVLTQGETVKWWEAIWEFGYSSGAAVLIGWFIGRGAAFLSSWMTSATARNAFTWVIPFITYLVAEEIHASGVIAVVIAAIEYNSRVAIGAEDRLSGTVFWEIVELLFTGVAFGLIGIMARDAIFTVGSDWGEAVMLGVVLSAVAIVVRGLWFLGMYATNKYTRYRVGGPLRLQETLLLTWAGMRGLVTLALILSIPDTGDFGLYQEAPVVALVVLLFTMVIPGLTLPALMKKLTLDSDPDAFGDVSREKLVNRARRAARNKMQSYAGEIPQERLEALMSRFDEETNLEEVNEEGITPEERREKAKHIEVKLQQAQIEALRAAQLELLRARRERDIDPAILDEVLFLIDRQILGAKARKMD